MVEVKICEGDSVTVTCGHHHHDDDDHCHRAVYSPQTVATRSEPPAPPVGDRPVTRRKADEVVSLLQAHRLVGFDPTIIITIITVLIGLFKDCNFSAEKTAQRLRLLSGERWYPGRVLDLRRLHRVIEDCECCDGSGCDVEDVAAAVRGVAGGVTTADVRAMYAEM